MPHQNSSFFFLLIVSFFIFAAIFPNHFPNTIEKKKPYQTQQKQPISHFFFTLSLPHPEKTQKQVDINKKK